jgi:hypothetical protein
MDLFLPRGYLSHSQMEVWRTDKARYIREYFEGGKRFDSKYLKFGKNIAELIETGKIHEIIPGLPTYEEPEYEIRVNIRGVPVLMFLDSYDPFAHRFLEYKTGKHAWTQAKVQKHDQLPLYCAGLRAKMGRMPMYCDLIWIPTKDKKHFGGGLGNDTSVELTGAPPVIFRRVFDPREIERIEALVYTVAHEISACYKQWCREHHPEILDLDI